MIRWLHVLNYVNYFYRSLFNFICCSSDSLCEILFWTTFAEPILLTSSLSLTTPYSCIVRSIPQYEQDPSAKIFLHILVWSPISNTRSLWMTLQYSCSFRTVHHQKQATGAKTFFKVLNWNQISSKPILLRFFAQVHRWWQCLFKYFQVLTWSGEGPRGKIIFLHFDWNYISIEPILYKYFMKVHWSWQWFI